MKKELQTMKSKLKIMVLKGERIQCENLNVLNVERHSGITDTLTDRQAPI